MAGTAATTLPAAPDPMKNILDILGQFGTGTTTSTSSSEPSDASTQQMQDLLKEISGSSSPEALNTLVQSILLKAKESFGPNIAASIGAGNRTTSDSSLALLQGNAQARATAESAQAILEARNHAEALATQLTDTRMNASRRSTQTQRTGASPAGKGLAALGAIRQLTSFGASANKNKGNQNQADDILNEAGGKTNYIEQGVAGAPVTPSTGGPGAVTDTIPGFEDISASSNLGASATDVPAIDTSIPFDSSGNTDTLGAPEDNTPAQTGPTGTSSTSPGSLNPPQQDPTNPPPTDNPNAPPPDDSSSWIICTELHKQGKMPTKYYIYGARAFAKYPEYGKQAYYFWAIPCVTHLRKYPKSLFSWCLKRIFVSRAEYLAAQQGLRGAKKTFFGLLVIGTTYSLCWIISRFQINPVDPIKELEKFNAN